MSAKGHSMGGKHSAKQASKSWKGPAKADSRKTPAAGLTDTNGDGRVDTRDILDRIATIAAGFQDGCAAEISDCMLRS